MRFLLVGFMVLEFSPSETRHYVDGACICLLFLHTVGIEFTRRHLDPWSLRAIRSWASASAYLVAWAGDMYMGQRNGAGFVGVMRPLMLIDKSPGVRNMIHLMYALPK